MQTVTIPGYGDVDFPDTMTSDQVNQAAQKVYLEHGMANDPNRPSIAKPNVPMEESSLGLGANAALRPASRGTVAEMENTPSPVAGAAKGYAQTVYPVVRAGANIASKVLGDGSEVLPTERPEAFNPKGVGEHIGYGAEAVGEFVFADAGLKSLSVLQRAEKALEAQKAAQVAASKSPIIARALEVGMAALRQGTVGGVQAAAHGEDAWDSVKTGLVTGGVGAAAEIAAPYLSEASGAVGKQLNRALGKSTAGEVDSTLRLNAGTAASIAAKEPPAGMLTPEGKLDVQNLPRSVRNVYETASDHVMGKAKSLFDTMDAATENQLGPVQSELRDIARNLRSADEEAAGKLIERRGILEVKQEQLLNKAEANGIPRQTINDARALWRQGSAMSDVDRAVKMSTSGLPPELANGTPGKYTPEVIDPKKLYPRMLKLYDSGRLLDAFGANGTTEGAAYDAAMFHTKQVLRTLDLAQTHASVFTQVLGDLGKHAIIRAGVGAGLGYEKGGVPGAVGGTLLGLAAPAVMAKVMASPTALRTLEAGLRTGASSAKIVPAIVNALQIEESSKQSKRTK